MPAKQIALLEQVAAANQNVVVVLSNGSVVSVAPWAKNAKGILESCLLGQAGGPALADVIFGQVSPSGKLAQSIPLDISDDPSTLNWPGEEGHVDYGEGVFVGYRYYDTYGKVVDYPFGYGLSYATFEIDDVAAAKTGANTATVTATVTNTSDVDAAETVQVYVAPGKADVARPKHELKGFTKVFLKAGESKTVTIDLDERAFAYWSEKYNDWHVEAGEYAIEVGVSSRDIADTVAVALDGDGKTQPLTEWSTYGEWEADPFGAKIVAAVAAAIRRNRVGISPKHKPVSFIFVGSTGVGKTELVKQLADDLFNAPESLIRLDMSEFMEKHSVSRIVGSPPVYVGYDEAGQLTEKIRRKPYSVVLFDEIEKAHPDVLNVLLQILDDGQITDAHGRKVNFENTVIVMTSNAGSDKAAGSVGFDKSAGDQGKERVMKALRDFLRPEFINRVDEVIYFHQLTEDNFRDIARIMLDELKTSLSEKGFGFMYDDSVVDVLVKKSYSAAYGARNLRRCIQKELEDPMANLIIDAFENPITQLKATAEDGQIKLYSL